MFKLKNKNSKARGKHKVNIATYYEGCLTEIDGIVECRHPHTVSTLQKRGYDLIEFQEELPKEEQRKPINRSALPSVAQPIFRPGEFSERNLFDVNGGVDKIEMIRRARGLDRKIDNSRAGQVFISDDPLHGKVNDLRSTFQVSSSIKMAFAFSDGDLGLLVKRSLWEEVGGFNGYDDTSILNFCERAKARGYISVYRRDLDVGRGGFRGLGNEIFSSGLAEWGGLTPLVSIIIPTYNRVATLAESVASIQNQIVKNGMINFEIILIDDGSTDDTRSWAMNMARDHSWFRYFRWPANTGAPAAHVNNAVQLLARGEYVIHAFDDDVWMPNLLEDLVSPLLADPGLDWAHGRVRSGGNSKGKNFKGKDYGGEMDLDALVAENYIPLQGCMFRRSSFLRLGGFDTSSDFRCGYDWDFVIRAGMSLRDRAINSPVAVWRPSSTGMIGEMWSSGKGAGMMKLWKRKWHKMLKERKECFI